MAEIYAFLLELNSKEMWPHLINLELRRQTSQDSCELLKPLLLHLSINNQS